MITRRTDLLQALSHVAQHFSGGPVALHQSVGLQLVDALLVRVQLLLQLRYDLCALLILLLENRLDPLDLLLVGVCRQLKVFVHVICKRQKKRTRISLFRETLQTNR